MSKSAIIYARFSSAQQGEGFSIERQLTLGRQFIEAKGWQFHSSIQDEARSAFHGKNRLEGAALHTFELEARNGLHKDKVLVVENLDRLTRQGAKAAAKLVWSLNECGVDVATFQGDGTVYLAEASDDLLSVFGLIIKSQMSHEESLNKSKRGKATWQNRHKRIAAGEKNVPVGKAPPWLVRTAEGYAVIPDRAAIINEVFDLYIAGLGFDGIAKKLNARGETSWTKSQRGWYQPYLHRLITNRAVTGEYLNHLTGEVLSSDFYPEIVSKQKFFRAQAMLQTKQRTGGRDSKKRRNLLTGIVFCGKCGNTAGYESKGENSFTPYVTKDGQVRKYARKHYERLRCDDNRRRATCDNNTLFDYPTVERAVLDKLLDSTLNTNNPKLNQLDEQIASTVRALEIEQTKLDNLLDAIEAGQGRALAARLGTVEQERDRLNDELEALRRQREIEAALPSRLASAALIEHHRANLTHDDPEVRFLARSQVNSSLKNLDAKVLISEDGTFSLLVDDWAAMTWQFDSKGELIAGHAL